MSVSFRLDPRTRALLTRYCRTHRVTPTEAIQRGIALLAREQPAENAMKHHPAYLAYLAVGDRVAPSMSGYCHCRNCQRLTGTPAMVWAQVPIAAFSYTAGEPAVYRSSETGERRFCQRCGGPLEFRRRPDPQTVEFYVATLDDPSRIVPQVHIFTRSRIPWFDTADTLPRLREFT